jgi:hypothetical protein
MKAVRLLEHGGQLVFNDVDSDDRTKTPGAAACLACVAEPFLAAAAAASNLQIGTLGSMNGRREETLLHGRICTHRGR